MQISTQELIPVKSSEKTLIPGQLDESEDVRRSLTISTVAPAFLDWTRYELRRAPNTIQRYREALGWVIRDIGDVPVTRLHIGHVLELRRRMDARGCGEARMASILNSLRSLLKFSRTVLGVPVLDPRQVRIPRVPRRDVVYLSKEEVQRFLDAIVPPGEPWEGVLFSRLRFRALVEVLLGTGARISEILSLDRSDVNLEQREAKIVGKGSKQRTLFFTDRSLEWLGRYLSKRHDDERPLFVGCGDAPGRLAYDAVKTAFQRFEKRSGIGKTITAHILRHTMATTLLFNGCPIGHIRVLLGHERLDTTCRYYLGLDLRAAKAAHEEFLKYE
jgi:site-specific recombinase XerD